MNAKDKKILMDRYDTSKCVSLCNTLLDDSEWLLFKGNLCSDDDNYLGIISQLIADEEILKR